MKYLGHLAGARGIRPDPEKVAAMKEMSPPLKNDKPDLRLIQVFLGVMNYYRCYMPGYAALVAPVAHLARGSKAEVAAQEWLPEHLRQ